MPRKRNKGALAKSFADLEFLPRGKSEWDCTLSALAYGLRMEMPGAEPDLGAWATRHRVEASARCEALGPHAMALWHGTSRERAEKIQEHGLFNKRGLWTARHPREPHGFCRMRSERLGTKAAILCLLLDSRTVVAVRDYEVEANGNVIRFQHGLPPDVVDYVLVRERIGYTGVGRASRRPPWPGGTFRRSGGNWVPVQQIPVRWSDAASFSTLDEYVALCLGRLVAELGAVAPLEALSVLRALVEPADALTHEAILAALEARAPRRIPDGRVGAVRPGPGRCRSMSALKLDGRRGRAHNAASGTGPRPPAAPPDTW